MLPSLAARDVEEGLKSFVSNEFPIASKTFNQDGKSVLDAFLDKPNSLTKGPWCEVKMPFRQAPDNSDVPFTHLHPNAIKAAQGFPFNPYEHQRLAFNRLQWQNPQSTIIATGTGSGKTECFLYPILDYCIANEKKGIKAIIIYPMNALASDQASRLARLISHINVGLKGKKLTAGIYTGDDDTKTSGMSVDSLISSRYALRRDPPDILLTNYRMLDFLLMRPDDQALWVNNGKDVLRYLVVDELHTFDGAQGTDLACLIRRLRARLQLQDSLVCVGTSATIGGPESIDSLCSYASAVFATEINADAVVKEDRLQPTEYLDSFGEDAPAGIWPDADIVRIRKRSSDLRNYLTQTIRLWFNGEDFGFSTGNNINESRAALGAALPNLPAFRRFVQDAKGVTDITELAEHWEGAIPEFRNIGLTKEERIACISEIIDSLIAMIAEARIKKVEVEEKDGKQIEKVSYLPFLNVRSQLWIRELARAVVSVSRKPLMALANDLQSLEKPLYLPVVGCRDCSSVAWGSFVKGGIRSSGIKVKPDLKSFYEGWFRHHQDTQLFYPIEDFETLRNHRYESYLLCPECHELQFVGNFKGNASEYENFFNNIPACICGCGDNVLVWCPDMTRDRTRRDGTQTTVLDNRCPKCLSGGSLRIFGAADASLTASMLAHVHASHFNEDDRVIAFSDSVQDAALRAGFLSSRSYMSVVRHAIVNYMSSTDKGVSRWLSDVLVGLPQYWYEEFKKGFDGNSDKNAEILAKAAFVATFVAPDQQGHRSWHVFADAVAKSNASIIDTFDQWEDLYGYVSERLTWQALVELGYWSGNGRTVQRVGAASIYPNLEDLDKATDEMRRLLSGLEVTRNIKRETISYFLLGLLEQMRLDGAFNPDNLGKNIQMDFRRFLETGEDWLFNLSEVMPTYGTNYPPPTGISPTTPKRRKFHSSLNPTNNRERSWYKEWAQKLVTHDVIFDAYLDEIFRHAMAALEKADLVTWIPATNMSDDGVWVTEPSRWLASRSILQVRCRKCERSLNVAQDSAELWNGMTCLSPGCDGELQVNLKRREANTYYSSVPVRINAEEHTALVDGDTRKRIEQSFKNTDSPWSVNLLSATPTLEMGIDIGSLSTVMQCSMPPNQASYLQRIGRAGRRDGNALALTMADRGVHSQYFWEDPLEMLEGEVTTPGVFLRAVAVLERQVMAFAIDRWVQSQNPPPKFPRNLGDALNQLSENDPAKFPNNLLEWITTQSPKIYADFMAMLNGPGGVTLPEEARISLQNFVLGVEEEGRPSLTRRVRICLERVLEQREFYRHKREELSKKLTKLSGIPDDPKVENEKEAIKQQRKAITKLISEEINRKNVFNFFTDEGLLPNYAFPEEGVTVNSVIIKRRTREEIKAGEKIEPVKFSFTRAAAQAIGELSPDSTFYVHAHRMRIDQVRMEPDSVELWRLCDRCSYMEKVDPTAPIAPACPRCASAQWSDGGRVRQLMRMREVIAHADSKLDRIRDEQDSRPPMGQARQVMIDIPDSSHIEQAWKIDDPNFAFGFEFLRKVTIREVNFGNLSLAGFADPLVVAGKEMPQHGFKLCRDCGMVYRENLRRGDNLHDITCKYRDMSDEKLKQLDESPWFDSLFLFREIESEAIRIRIPVSDLIDEVGAELGTRSLVAAISLGLRRHFKGAVDHLKIDLQDEPIPDSESGRNSYLVIYDSVPGGSGYLKDLARKDEKTGKPEELRKLFREAYEAVANCACANDESRDGCYQCVYQFRDGLSRDSISRQEAERLMERIASCPPEKFVPVDTLANLPSTSQSVLEQLFLKRLKSLKEISVTFHPTKDGREAYEIDVPVTEEEQKLWQDVLGRNIGDRLTWQLLTQIDITAKDGADYPSRPDFTFRPLLQTVINGHPELISHVFTDGWQYHANILSDDTQKRQSILNLGHRVWSMTWDDLKEPDEDTTVPSYVGGLVSNADYERAQIGWFRTFSGQFVPPVKDAKFGETSAQSCLQKASGSFTWLIEWLKGPLSFSRKMAAAVQFGGITQKPTAAQNPSAEEQKQIPRPLIDMQMGQLFKQWRLPSKNPGFDVSWQVMAISQVPPILKLASAIRIDEKLYADKPVLKDDKLHAVWQTFWQYANVMQFADRFFVCTKENELSICYTNDAKQPEDTVQTAPETNVDDDPVWLEVMKELDNDAEFFAHIIPAIRQIRETIVEPPEIGIDGWGDEVISEPSGLKWEKEGITICMFAEADLIEPMPEEIEENTVILLDTMPDWLEQLKSRLTVKGEQ